MSLTRTKPPTVRIPPLPASVVRKTSDSHLKRTKMSGSRGRKASDGSDDSMSSQSTGSITPEHSPTRPRTTRKRTATEYEGNDEEREVHTVVTSHTRGPSDTSASNVCLCQPDLKIPRPRNAFILYRQHHASNILAQHPGVTNPDISKIIGDQWNNQSPEVKNEWKNLAEEEKLRHQQQFPDYRYQPRRNARRPSNAESPLPTPSSRCNKCGGRTLASPTTPATAFPPRPILPPPTPFSAAFPNGRPMPMMNGLSLASPQLRRSSRQHPANLAQIAQLRDVPDDDRRMPMSPDAKRRRFTNAGRFVPISSHQAANTPSMISPYRESFSRGDGHPIWSPYGSRMMGPPPRPLQSAQLRDRNMSLTLPPLQAVGDQSRSVEAMVMSMPFLNKIQLLGKVSPPLRRPGPASPPRKVRGALIAVEGDDQTAIQEVVTWLEDFLTRGGEHRVKVAPGPTAPEDGKEPALADYLALMLDWHSKGKEIIDYITTSAPEPKEPKEPQGNQAETGETAKIPVMLMNRYHFFASNAYAARMPIFDAYSPIDHWQWMATMWRGIVGPDVTVYVKDATAEEMAKEKVVDVQERERCVVVRREKGPGPVLGKLEESTLRRLGFEIGEWVRGVGKVKEVERGS